MFALSSLSYMCRIIINNKDIFCQQIRHWYLFEKDDLSRTNHTGRGKEKLRRVVGWQWQELIQVVTLPWLQFIYRFDVHLFFDILCLLSL
jgi:hypothetical protein